MTSTLTAVASSSGAPTNNLEPALDTALVAGPQASPLTDIGRALDVALLVSDSLTVDEVGHRLGIPAATVARYARDGELNAVTLSGYEGTPLFPDWQFTDTTCDGVLPFLGAVLHRVTGDVPPMMLSQWMVAPHPALTVGDGVELSPRAWLLYTGEPGPVLDLAPLVGVFGN